MEEFIRPDGSGGAIADNIFIDFMDSTVQPYIKARCREEYFQRTPGQLIRYVRYQAHAPRGTVVISHGFTEAVEKYDESVYYLLGMGYSVYVCDHRGHGKSFRETPDASLIHIGSFSDYVEDFLFFVHLAREESGAIPLLLGHSMGGAIGVLAMERQPELFQKAVLLSPMFKMGQPIPQSVQYAVSRLMCAVGRGERYVLGQSPFLYQNDFENDSCRCRERYDYAFRQRCENRYLQTNAASYGWGMESIKAARQLMRPRNLRKLTAPIAIFSTPLDATVSPAAHRRFVDQVKSARLYVVANGKHELFTDVQENTTRLWQDIFDFYSL